MNDSHEEIRQCRLLLSMLAEKLARLEGNLFPGSKEGNPLGSPAFLTADNIGKRDAHAFQSMQLDGMGDATSFLRTVQQGIGDYPTIHTSQADGMGAFHSFLSTATEAEKSTIADTIVKGLSQLLKNSELKKLGINQVLHTAKFLYRVYEGGAVRYPHITLAKLTGMSVSGIGKLVMALRRRGLIETIGFQRYKLTEKAAGYMREAMKH